MLWRHKEPGHRQQWYWLYSADAKSQGISNNDIDYTLLTQRARASATMILTILWRHKEPGHRQQWYWLYSADAKSQGISNNDIDYTLATQRARASATMILTILWWRKEPGHQQPWYWLCWTEIIRFPHFLSSSYVNHWRECFAGGGGGSLLGQVSDRDAQHRLLTRNKGQERGWNDEKWKIWVEIRHFPHICELLGTVLIICLSSSYVNHWRECFAHVYLLTMFRESCSNRSNYTIVFLP